MSKVTLTGFPELGMWRVHVVAPEGWCVIYPLDEAGVALSSLGTRDMVWVQQTDLTRHPNQQETLF